MDATDMIGTPEIAGVSELAAIFRPDFDRRGRRPGCIELSGPRLVGGRSVCETIDCVPDINLPVRPQVLDDPSGGELAFDALCRETLSLVSDAQCARGHPEATTKLDFFGAAPEPGIRGVTKSGADFHPNRVQVDEAVEEVSGAVDRGGEPGRVGRLGIGDLSSDVQCTGAQQAHVGSR